MGLKSSKNCVASARAKRPEADSITPNSPDKDDSRTRKPQRQIVEAVSATIHKVETESEEMCRKDTIRK